MDNKFSNNFVFLKFEDSKVPEFKESPRNGWVDFGENNDYPDYLIKMTNKSAKHNAIVNGKVNYIFGKGPESENEKVKSWFQKCNTANEGMVELLVKTIKDIEVFGGFYWQIIPDKTGNIAEIYHCNFKNWRSSPDRGTFYFKKDWKKKFREDAKPYPKYQIGIKVPSIFSYREYRQDQGVYPLPGYIASLNWIEADFEVSKQTLSNAKTGFSASKLISLFNGEPTPEEMREITRMFNEKFTGSDGTKVMLSFNNEVLKKPQVDDLGDSDLTKEDFSAVDELITSNIFAGHQITTPALFGIKEKGQLGGTTELKVGYEIFKNTYVNFKQKQVEEVLNYFSKIMFGVEDIKLQDVDPIGFVLTPTDFKEMLPKEWVLKKFGVEDEFIQPSQMGGVNDNVKNLTAKQHQQIMRIVREFNKGKMTRAAATAMLKSGYGFNDVDVVSFLGEEEQAFSVQFSEETVASLFEGFGAAKTEFEILKSKPATFEEDGEFSFTETFAAVEEKTKTPTPPPAKGKTVMPEVMIKYSYEKRPEAAGSEIKDTTRPFCKKLLTLDRLYSRSEIQQISMAVGYSVWNRSGGFWTHGKNDQNPGERDSRCRHEWRSHIVIKKK
jgi:hypothetical protein